MSLYGHCSVLHSLQGQRERREPLCVGRGQTTGCPGVAVALQLELLEYGYLHSIYRSSIGYAAVAYRMYSCSMGDMAKLLGRVDIRLPCRISRGGIQKDTHGA